MTAPEKPEPPCPFCFPPKDRGGRLRLLTGDYLGITDPDALTRLLDLSGDRHIRVFETATETGPAWPGPPSPLSFHPKAYLFHRKDGTGAFVGRSDPG